DLKRVTKIARAMVTKYAMSDNLGAMSYDDGEEVFIGRDFGAQREYSDNVAATIDHEIRLIVDAAYDKANRLLEANLDKLHVVAQALLKYETINGEEFNIVFEQGMDALDLHVEEQKKKIEEDREKHRREEQARLEAERLRAEQERLARGQAVDVSVSSAKAEADSFERAAEENIRRDNPFSKE
ncbi:MAG: zinc metalloprotease, partial [Bacillota bacterium]|nr:zinc metalloprotease [Bacillota bacterium]